LISLDLKLFFIAVGVIQRNIGEPPFILGVPILIYIDMEYKFSCF